MLDEPGVDGLGHVDVDAETDGDDVWEEEDESEKVAVPGAVEALERHHDKTQDYHWYEENFGQVVDLEVEETALKMVDFLKR